MRVSREQAARNRARSVDAALRAFRTHGFDGVSIADLMASAGLTHGGFYKNFASKQALELEASVLGIERSIVAIAAMAEPGRGTSPTGGESIEESTTKRRIAEAYLTAQHRDEPANGCTVAALAVDAGRSSVEIQRAFAQGVVGMAQRVAHPESPPMAEGQDPASENDLAIVSDDALADVAALVGALVLARAVKDADPRLSARILDSTIQHVSSPRPA